MCQSCSYQSKERRFCTGCGRPNEKFDQSLTGTLMDRYADEQCRSGHSNHKSIEDVFNDQPCCAQCGQLVTANTIGVLWYTGLDRHAYEEDSSRLLSIGMRAVIGAVDEYCEGQVLNLCAAADPSEPLYEPCPDRDNKTEGHDPFQYCLVATNSKQDYEEMLGMFTSPSPEEALNETDLFLLSILQPVQFVKSTIEEARASST
jgi:hypothetical protein